MTNLPEIAACPFCHSPRTRLSLPEFGEWFFVECAVCDATGSTRPNAAEAVDVWNRVAHASAALVALEAAYSALNGQFAARIEQEAAK
jgi:transcription elongation factor Elf1